MLNQESWQVLSKQGGMHSKLLFLYFIISIFTWWHYHNPLAAMIADIYFAARAGKTIATISL